MAKPKPPTRILARIFDRTTSPVYVVNSQHVIEYANEACSQWVGLELTELINSSCVYCSQEPSQPESANSEVQTKVQGLCPSPELLTGLRDVKPSGQTQIAVFTKDAQGKNSWRTASLSRLLDADQNNLGVLAVCSEQAFDEPPELAGANSPGEAQFERLHTSLASIRTSTDSIHSLESLVGTSPFANRMRRQVSTAVETKSDLLIFGPPGSGKEHLARTVHALRDPSQSSELIPIHCSIADQQLIQQNIKDIVATRTGSQSTSDNQDDWLLLLDIDQLGEAAQNELLGFFQLPNFPLRTIATCTNNLITLAADGNFSNELAHQLSTFTIELATLAKRKPDVPFLAQALIERENFRRDRQLSGFSNEVLDQFIEFHWPENIDQLNRTIQLAVQSCTSNQIDVADLPAEFSHALKAMRVGVFVETEINLEDYLAQIEKELVARALQHAKGNKTKAAKLLGVSRPKLLRRVQLFELEAQASDSENGELDSSAFEELE